ncbi:RluA family pseudouridine synthase [Paucilactobacillus wasatchensis]|uniref:Pseudouridine synthase n=1 Tax=Paucilactobacillus wasatchensis TaxID=1335616 RepID=A0A0D0YXT9_9LACO|nr:RluA family pseudouridine synthase [Paucilactobacillus wasatchensis]KIS04024.1 Ribosomal large subunit pseudouridine synthase D [Paucilactobacillus wasatchensis]
MSESFKLTIEDETQCGRVDKVLSSQFTQFSRAQIQKWILAGAITVNAHSIKAKDKLTIGDQVIIKPTAPKTLSLIPENIALDIIYEDQDVIVVNKPQGMVVHPSVGHPDHTLVNALLYHSPLSTINGEFRPGIVHRIDKDTSGLLMIAKNDRAHRSLAAQLKNKTNQREYVALVHGQIKENSGVIDAPIGRSPANRQKQAIVSNGRHAVTHFKVLKRYEHYTLVSCQLETGRTHQIRVHMQYINHPVAGDPLYGPHKTLAGNGQYLHARLLGFKHPTTGKQMTFEAPLPQNFIDILAHLDATDNLG